MQTIALAFCTFLAAATVVCAAALIISGWNTPPGPSRPDLWRKL